MTPAIRAVTFLSGIALFLAWAAYVPSSPIRDLDHPGSPPGIGVLMPDSQTSRWEELDAPLIERRVRQICGACEVKTVNGLNDVATQQQQVSTMITKGFDALIIGAVDAMSIRSSVQQAHEAGLAVIAYDRLAEGPIDGYVSFDNERVGRMQGSALLRALGGREGARGESIVMLNGSPTDPNSAEFAEGARAALGDTVEIAKDYDTPGWDPRLANINMSGAIADLGPDAIDGVYAANDGLASGAIAALRAAHLDPPPPVTGQDAELAAIQRIVEGDQYMTVYKSIPLEARSAADMAVAMARGEPVAGMATSTVGNGTVSDIPAVLARPVAVTADNVAEVIVADGVYAVDDICTPRYEPACERRGLLP